MRVTPANAEPLITAAELADYPGSPHSDVAVSVASALVRGACHWHIAPSVEVTFNLDTDGSRVVALPALHLDGVVSVTDRLKGPVQGYSWSHTGLIELPYAPPFSLGRITAVVRVGLPEVPLDIAATVAELARSHDASRTRPPDLRSRTVGGVSYVWATPDTKLIADPLARFEHVLRRYRV